jgi:putative oxidoreductase
MVAPLSLQSGLLLLRVWLGAMMIVHGQGKVLGDNAKFMAGVAELGFPVPEFFGWAAALSEFVGGILLVLGFGTRITSIMVAITMAVAAFMGHAGDPFRVRELALTYLVLAIVVCLLGPGRVSIDAAIGRRRTI